MDDQITLRNLYEGREELDKYIFLDSQNRPYRILSQDIDPSAEALTDMLMPHVHPSATNVILQVATSIQIGYITSKGVREESGELHKHLDDLVIGLSIE